MILVIIHKLKIKVHIGSLQPCKKREITQLNQFRGYDTQKILSDCVCINQKAIGQMHLPLVTS